MSAESLGTHGLLSQKPCGFGGPCRRTPGRYRGLFARILGVSIGLSDQCRRKALALMACFHKNRVALAVLVGGLLGGIGGYSLEYWVSVLAYPINVGGKPWHSWPAFTKTVWLWRSLSADSWAV